MMKSFNYYICRSFSFTNCRKGPLNCYKYSIDIWVISLIASRSTRKGGDALLKARPFIDHNS